MSRYQRSGQLYRRASRTLAGGVSSQFRMQTPTLYFDRGRGSRLWDVDGNSYIDYVLGQGPCIVGHAHPYVLERVREAMERGTLFAGQHDLEIAVAERVHERVPCADLVRFGSVGSEVVQAALRAARSLTGRAKVIKFEGHYHGWFDNIAVSINPSLGAAGDRERPHSVAWSKGQAVGAFADLIVLPWNDLTVLERAFEQDPDIAAVIMEPVMNNCSCIAPGPGYLEGVRALCDRFGALLIFDEIITGFRLGLGGAQELYGVTPDLATFAKAMAGGFSVSMLAGSATAMDETARGQVVHAGTYNSNVPVMAASLATIELLERGENGGYPELERKAQLLREGLTEAAAEAGLPILLQGAGSIFHMGFTQAERVLDYRGAFAYDSEMYGRFARLMLDRGVRLLGRGIWYLSTAHTDADVAQTFDAARDALRTLAQQAGTEQA